MPVVSGGTRPELAKYVRNVADFPKLGIEFRDLTPLFADPVGWRSVIDGLAETCRALAPDVIVGIEARGFVVAAPVAYALGLGFVPVRKPGKLPFQFVSESYNLEYGNDALELHVDGVLPDQRVIIIDDVLATGGTAIAAATLVDRVGGIVVGASFVLELGDLGGRQRLLQSPAAQRCVVGSLVTYS